MDKYKMCVTIKDPKSAKIKELELTAIFGDHPTPYGNGKSLFIASEDREFEQLYDIRYDTEYRSDKQIDYLYKWANGYWSGENGAYEVIAMDIERSTL